MSKSQRVRAADQLAILRLVNECRDLGDDAAAWQARMSGGLQQILKTIFGSVGITPTMLSFNKGGMEYWAEGSIGIGWPSEEVRDRWMRFAKDPSQLAHHPDMVSFLSNPNETYTATRTQLVHDHDWNRSQFVNEILRADGFDDAVVSRSPVNVIGGSYGIVVMRSVGDRPFEDYHQKLVEHLQLELAPHLGRTLLLTTQPNLVGLSPRLRTVLNCLLEGESEKTTATRLGLQISTVHDYVKRLYLHFGVNSRAELLAYFLKRYRPTQ